MEKYVFFDIDGTLLPEGEKDIPKENIEAVKKLKENGVVPFICTGRCYHQAKKYIEQIGAESYIVSNGQEVNVLGEDVYSYNLSEKEIDFLFEKVKNTNVVWGYETRERVFINDMPGSKDVQDKMVGYGIVETKITKKHTKEGIKQMWVFGESESIDRLQNDIIDNFKCYRWNDLSMEIIPLEESKGKAVSKVLKNVNSKVTTYAFGDGYNDMELLEEVDYGVAMGNAYDEVKAIASHITSDCRDGGIEKGLKELGLID